MPDGQYNHLEKSGKKAKANPLRELVAGLCNYRMYGLAACYAYSFGVEVRSHSSAVDVGVEHVCDVGPDGVLCLPFSYKASCAAPVHQPSMRVTLQYVPGKHAEYGQPCSGQHMLVQTARRMRIQ